MEFLRYPLPESGELPPSREILKSRRLDLRLTQQQVATGANIQLQQYQRLESGERNIESASMRVALSVCAVLKLDPFFFFPDCISMNKVSDTTKKPDVPLMKEEAIPLILEHACNICNKHLKTNYSLENIKVAYCTIKDCVEVYTGFTAQYGFHSESRTVADFEYVIAESFVGQTDIDDPKHVDGILLRTDPPRELDRPDYYLSMLIHELCHIFCTTHEIPTAGKAGQRFYDLYCEGAPGTPAEEYNNGFMNAGYAIWREFIADIIQDIVYQQPNEHLKDIAPMLRFLADDVRVSNSAAKSAFHRYLSEIMNSWEGSEAETWEDLEAQLKALGLPFLHIVKKVFNNLHGKDCHTIDPDFIADLGACYLVDLLKNSTQEELVRFTETYGYKFKE